MAKLSNNNSTRLDFPRDTFIYRIDFSEDLFLGNGPNYAQGAPKPQPLYHVTSAPGHKILSSTQGTTSLADTPHIQLHAGPSQTDPVFGRGWYDGPFNAFIALDTPDGGGKGMDERVELSSRNKSVAHFFDASVLSFEEFGFGGQKYRLKVGRSAKTEAIKQEYLKGAAAMVEGNQFYFSGLEIEILRSATGDWSSFGAFAGARTSMKWNPKRILGVVRWNDEEWVDSELRMLGMMVFLVVTEQARRMALAEANDKKQCIMS